LSPLVGLVHCRQQVVQGLALESLEEVGIALGVANLKKGSTSVCNNICVSILEETFEKLDHILLFNNSGVDTEKLCDGDSSGLLDVRVIILERVFKTLGEFNGDLLDPDATHGSDSKSSHKWACLLSGILLERIDSHDGEVSLALGVVNDVKIHEFLQLD